MSRTRLVCSSGMKTNGHVIRQLRKHGPIGEAGRIAAKRGIGFEIKEKPTYTAFRYDVTGTHEKDYFQMLRQRLIEIGNSRLNKSNHATD